MRKILRDAFTLFVILLALHSCAEKEATPPYKLPSNAKTLLVGNSYKVWKLARRFNNKTRMNMGDCFLSHRDTYLANQKMHNNSGDFRDCGETLEAEWKFIKDQNENYYIKLSSEQIPKLLNIEEEFKLFKILKLEEDEMILQFRHKQFSDKTTTITDIYVPEDVNIRDREFHW